jgi:hypothetical protein
MTCSFLSHLAAVNGAGKRNQLFRGLGLKNPFKKGLHFKDQDAPARKIPRGGGGVRHYKL